ncbi:DUF4382 domain-containing protein [Psychromonas sp. Urea-02u-13]|uniref:DUF4382 domain-containing protein n=1 Tax=Psychromonas sp. Urea-02u-13 TaxID=2058326 RepID=UPI000C342F9E|nr:DUF4382 domain-containing protein [Psychromonas sp. Urea-02u-13]PKG38608.1 hypothetical protein CXF74_12885 [Psychromonas sp. Urea-02u-13]
MLKNTLSIPFFSLLLLVGCGGESGSSNSSSGSVTASSGTTFSLSVSDAPVEALSKVIICFSQIELKSEVADVLLDLTPNPLYADELCVDKNSYAIDLKMFTGADYITLLEGIIIEAGDYSQLRLIMSEGSYGVFADDDVTTVAIKVPSNELKLDGFTAVIGGVIDLTAEFDLNKGMTNPVGLDYYFLKPRGVRLVDNSESATVAGSVDADDFCTLSNPEVGDIVGSVYLYQGFDLAIENLADNGGDESQLPYASAMVTYKGETDYEYEVGFVTSGNYTVAFSCDSDDLPEEDNSIVFEQKLETQVGTEKRVLNFVFADL